MLYMILYQLHAKSSTSDTDDIINIIHRDLWSVFAPAVARMRAQCHQEFRSAGLPLELFLVSHYGPFVPTKLRDPDFLDPVDPRKLFEWHVKTCIQRDTGVNTWHFCSSKKHQFALKNFSENIWHDFMRVLDKYLPTPQKEALDIENLRRNAPAEWRQTLAIPLALFMIRHLISMFVFEPISVFLCYH
ncbi:hypothetical protein BJ165DRAFT_1426397 [Panaeolus papilionaceus]|nr:hypothetical protein BJ165DRAFT_1426397 [Panaeolus papilionaceus]